MSFALALTGLLLKTLTFMCLDLDCSNIDFVRKIMERQSHLPPALQIMRLPPWAALLNDKSETGSGTV